MWRYPVSIKRTAMQIAEAGSSRVMTMRWARGRSTHFTLFSMRFSIAFSTQYLVSTNTTLNAPLLSAFLHVY